MKSKNIALVVITSGLTALLSSCSTGKSEETKMVKTASAIPVVETVNPLANQPLYSLTLPGELRPFEQVDVYAKAKGFVKKIYD